MTATNHGLFGATIAIGLQRYPALAIAIAPLSHFLLDALPHFRLPDGAIKTKKFIRILIADSTLAVVSTLILAWFWQDIALLLVTCAFLAASPDLMWIKYQFLNPIPRSKWPWFARFHSSIQWSQTINGIYIEVVWFVMFFGIMTYFGAS